MPYHKKKKTDRPPRGLTPEHTMKAAVDEVILGRAVNTVARERGIDRMTLKRYVRKCRTDPNTACKPNFVTKQIFSVDEEKSLAEFLLKASKLHYGLSTKETRKLAYDYAISNGKQVPESWNHNGCAGKDWLRDFMKRSGSLSLRTPEATSFSRATAWNKHTKDEFFTNLREARCRHDYPPQNIYNVDETALTTVQKPQKIVAGKGSKQVGRMTSAERGTLVTACCCANAVGNTVPVFFVYPRVHFKPHMMIGGPAGCIGTANPSGWMTAECFLQWMKHFATFAQCSSENRVLLLLDNHDSHISYDCLQFASENGITMLTFPPHTTHKLQPLDVSVYGPLKRFYNASCDSWMMSNARPMTIYDIASVSTSAFAKAFTPANIVAGFKRCGIEPFDTSLFDEDGEFLAASVTDRPPPAESVPSVPDMDATSSDPVLLPVDTASTEQPAVAADTLTDAALSSPSTAPCVTPSATAIASPTVPSSLEELLPFPKAGPRKATNGRRRQKSRILTDTPVREEMRQQQERKKIGKAKACSNNKAKKRLNMTAETDKNTAKKNVGQRIARSRPGKRPVELSKRPPLPRQPTWLVKRVCQSDTVADPCRPIDLGNIHPAQCETVQAITVNQSDTVADPTVVDLGNIHRAQCETVQTIMVNQSESEQRDADVVIRPRAFYGKRSNVGLHNRQSKIPKRYND